MNCFSATWRSILAYCCMASALCGTEFSPGGVTFPMEKISAERFAPQSTAGENLLKGGLKEWKGGIWIFGSGANKAKKKEAETITGRNWMKIDDKEVLELDRPAKLEELLKDQTPQFTTSFSRTVQLPDLEGGSYRLTFQSRSRKIGSLKSEQLVLYYFYDNSKPGLRKGKQTREYAVSHINATPEWGPYRYEFSVPKGTRDLSLSIRVSGCGNLQFRDLKLEKITGVSGKVAVELSPMKLLDNCYALASETPGTVGFRFRSNLPPGKLPWGKNYVFNIELPASVKVLEVNSLFGKILGSKPLTVNGIPCLRHEVDCSKMINSVRNLSRFNGWSIPCLLLYSKEQPGKSFDCSYYITEKGKVISARSTFKLEILPKMRAVKAPEQFLTGFSSVPGDLTFYEHGEMLGRFFADCGINMVTGGWKKELNDQFRKAGIRRITSECFSVANGFRIGMPAEKDRPADSIYRDHQGKPVIRHGKVSTCPVAVYTKGEYYKKHVLPILQDELSSGIDGLQPNWEPWWWRSRGCFCDNCRAEFAKYTGMPLEQVKKVWPAQLMSGQLLHERAIAFRGWQHARLIETLHDCFIRNGASMGFIPEVGTDQIVLSADYNVKQGEFTPYAYAGKLKWLNVWGPYSMIIADQPYAYVKGEHLRFFGRSLAVFRDYGRRFPDKSKRAKLMAMPHGSQLSMRGLSQPEGQAMDQLSAFLTGYEASLIYFFPRSYDHRYWKVFASVNADIARNEELVLNGKKRGDFTVTPLTPFAAPVENVSGKFELLQVVGFEKKGKLLAAVGNFWEKGDVIFLLRIPGLEENGRYSVVEHAFNRHYVAAPGRSFTGKELAKGIKLHAGAMRWVFFEISHVYRFSGEAVTASTMDEVQKLVAARTAPAAEAEAARDRKLHAENDHGELKNITSGALKCTVEKNTFVLHSGNSSAVLDPKGMTLTSWRVCGMEQGAPNFGLACCWAPGAVGFVSSGMFRITGEKALADGLEITGELTSNVRNYPELPGLKFIKTVFFSSDLKRITMKVQLVNPGEVAMAGVGFRWTIFPAAWNNRTPGKIGIGGKRFARFHRHALLKEKTDPQEESLIRKLFAVEKSSDEIAGNSFAFEIPGKPVCRCTLEPAGLFGGSAVWDTASLVCATFEPFYRRADIGPCDKMEFSMKLEIK